MLGQLLNKGPALRPYAAELRQVLADVARPPQPSPRQPPAPEGGNTLVRVLRAFGARLRTSRRWQSGAGGAAVALAAALTLFFVLTADQAPEGWSTRNEDKRVRATLAVPDDCERSAGEQAVTFTDPGDVLSLEANRSSKDVKGNVLAEANSWKSFYERGASDSVYIEMLEVKSRVTEAKQQGREAAEVLTTYQPTNETGTAEGPRKFRHELVYVSGDGVRRRLQVEMPAKGEARRDGERVYEEAKKFFKIHDLWPGAARPGAPPAIRCQQSLVAASNHWRIP